MNLTPNDNTPQTDDPNFTSEPPIGSFIKVDGSAYKQMTSSSYDRNNALHIVEEYQDFQQQSGDLLANATSSNSLDPLTSNNLVTNNENTENSVDGCLTYSDTNTHENSQTAFKVTTLQVTRVQELKKENPKISNAYLKKGPTPTSAYRNDNGTNSHHRDFSFGNNKL